MVTVTMPIEEYEKLKNYAATFDDFLKSQAELLAQKCQEAREAKAKVKELEEAQEEAWRRSRERRGA